MYGTKVEITLPKAEPGHWSNLDFPKFTAAKAAPIELTEATPAPDASTSDDDSDDVDLEEIEPLRAVKITDA